MFEDGACGFRPVQAGSERKRNRQVEMKRMFRARAAPGGKGRGWGRWASEERREWKQDLALRKRSGERKINRVL